MTSPFDDPDFRDFLAERGIIHEPGMAARLLDDVAPLLADEGFDLDDLDEVDPDQLNEALGRAVERHNMELFTPIGLDRQRALAILRRFIEELVAGRWERAREILNTVPIEPSDTMPAISHVIGVSVTFLDDCYSNAELIPALTGIRIPVWGNYDARRAARDVLATARLGQSFNSLQEMHLSNGGKSIFEGGALIVAATISAIAAHRGVELGEVSAELLGDGGVVLPEFELQSGPVVGAQSALPGLHALPGLPRPDSEALLQRFSGWLQLNSEGAELEVSNEAAFFRDIAAFAVSAGLDAHDPADTELLLETAEASENGDDPELFDAIVEALHDYIHFRMSEAGESSEWYGPHEAVERAGESGDSLMDLILEAAAVADEVDPDLRREGLSGLSIVRAVDQLLGWIGGGRRVTSTGSVLRSDIAYVAGLLGISAVGVNKRPPLYEDKQSATFHVRSMWEIPVLAAWWQALESTGLIRMTGTRVISGAYAATWDLQASAPLKQVEAFAGTFVAELFVRGAEGNLVFGPEEIFVNEVAYLAEALAQSVGVGEGESIPLEPLLDSLMVGKMSELEKLGMCTLTEDGAVIREAFRGVIAFATALIAMHVTDWNDLDGADMGWGDPDPFGSLTTE